MSQGAAGGRRTVVLPRMPLHGTCECNLAGRYRPKSVFPLALAACWRKGGWSHAIPSAMRACRLPPAGAAAARRCAHRDQARPPRAVGVAGVRTHHRDDRRAALRPVPTRQQGLSLSSTTIDKGGPIAARPCSVSIHLGKVFIRKRSDSPSCHTFSPAYPRFAMSSSVRSMMPAARLSPACTMVTSGESVLAES